MQLPHRTAPLGHNSSNSRCYRPPPLYTATCTHLHQCSTGPVRYIHTAHVANSVSNRSTARSNTGANSTNPDLDEIELDDAYYEEIGMTRDEAIRQQKEMLFNVDPDALMLDDIGMVDKSLPEEWRKAIENLEVYGPKALIMAGFRAEEYAAARATLDQLGADAVKVLPATHDMLQSPLDLALSTPEIDWSSPRPPEWILGGAWGSQRTIMFSGLSLKAQATILEYLEAQGLPHICVTMALKEDGDKKLGELLAAAVQAQRNAKMPKVAPWEVPRQSAAAAAADSSNNAPSSSTSSSSGSVTRISTASSSSDDSSSSSRRGINLSTLPGRKGPLFSRPSPAAAAARPGSSSSSSSVRLNEDGLEDLQDLISPDVAKQRLRVNAEEISNKITDILDIEVTDDYDMRRNTQQQSSSSSSSSSSATAGAQEPKDNTQAVLDWFNDESTGKTVELPWEDDQPAAAAAAAAAGIGVDGSSIRGSDSGLDISLDDLLPGGNATFQPAAAADIPVAPRTAASSSSSNLGSSSSPLIDAASEDGVSVFSAIQAALKSGVNPEQLKQLIDAAAAAGAAATDPIDLLLNEDAAMQRKARETADALKAAGSSNNVRNASNSTTSSSANAMQAASASAAAAAASRPVAAGAAAAPPKPQAEYGPELPPPGAEFGQSHKPGALDADPLLKLRPEIERAFQNNQIKFVDMNKLPRKYKQRYTQEALQQQLQRQQQKHLQQQQQEAGSEKQQQRQQRWWQQRRSQQQQQLVQGLSSGVAGKLPAGGKIVEVDVAGGVAGDSQQQQQQQQQETTTYTGYEVEQNGEFTSAPAAEDVQAADTDTVENNSNDVSNDDEDDMLFDGAELVGEDEEDDFSEPLWFDESQLQGLVESARDEGLDPTRALAQALAFGVQVQPEVAAAVGVALPDQDMIEAARAEIVGSIREMQADQGLGDNDTVVLGQDGYQGLAGSESPSHDEGLVENPVAENPGTDDALGFKGVEVAAIPEGLVKKSSGEGRVWGSGITRAVSRAKARLAEKKQQQQQ